MVFSAIGTYLQILGGSQAKSNSLYYFLGGGAVLGAVLVFPAQLLEKRFPGPGSRVCVSL